MGYKMIEKYREELVQQIKDCGQDLIDNAEKYVDDTDMLTDMTIYIRFELGQSFGSSPTIDVTKTGLCKHTVNRKWNKWNNGI